MNDMLLAFLIILCSIYCILKIQNIIMTQVKNQLVKVELSIECQHLVDCALAIWQIEKHLKSLANDNTLDIKIRPINSGITKILSILNQYHIEIKDYTGEKYNEGMNINIIDTIKNSNVKETRIIETVSPTIICNGQIVKKARVIKEIGVNENE